MKKIVFVAVVVVILLGGFVVWMNPMGSFRESAPADTTVPSSGTHSTADWKTYTNENFGFSVKYPPWFTAKEQDPELTSEQWYQGANVVFLSSTDRLVVHTVKIRATSHTTSLRDPWVRSTFAHGPNVTFTDDTIAGIAVLRVSIGKRSNILFIKNGYLFTLGNLSDNEFSLDDLVKNMSFMTPRMTATEVLIEVSEAKIRDQQRITDIQSLQVVLELYYSAEKQYPKTLSELATKFPKFPPILVDPSDQTPYAYAVTVYPGPISYHLGVSVERKDDAHLSGDRDCNSLNGVSCTTKYKYDPATAFDGSDAKGCRGEKNRYCYDVAL